MFQGHKIVTVGEILVEFVSHTRNCALQRIGDYSGPYPSGAPAIFLDQAARMGAQTAMFGGVGDDGFGRLVLDRLQSDGVGIEGVSVMPGRSTGAAFVSYHDSGARDFIFHLAGTAADSFDLTATMLPPGPLILHVSAASLGVAPLRNAILTAVDAVHGAGGRITCDPNARPQLMQDADAHSALQRIIGMADCLMPSTSDLEHLYPGLDETAAIDRLMRIGAGIVAIKRGADGATITGGGQRFDFPGHQVTELDPTGAGDCFCGTLVAALVAGQSLEEAGRTANAAGAIAVTRRGPMEGNSDPGEIAAFLAAGTSSTTGRNA